ncbi:MAG: DUF5658 family protein [Candidatus Bathyarchaeota archaeon]|nr:DUF5658 family protein [Candidatus Bathyarchaeota archaeon]
MPQGKAYAGIVLVLMGSVDLLTTVVGVVYFRAVECNPLLAGILNANFVGFVVFKATATIFAGLFFYYAGKLLAKVQDKTAKAYILTRHLLRVAYLGISGFMITVLVNNFLVLIGI